MPASHTIDVYVGDSWPVGPPGTEFLLTVNQNASPLDLRVSGNTPTAVGFVKERRGDTNAQAIATMTATVKDQASFPGQIGLQIPASETSTLVDRTYYYDVQLTWSSESPVVSFTPLAGLVRATAEVSQ